ncbi:MAG: hypothetical protein L0Y37_04010 [Bacteroidales bacterium]|nr:hypothetical protein [Bacteroidales bacterium]
MSPVTTYTSRKGFVPCGDSDLYTFLTDMRNFRSVVPEGIITDWQATEDTCSFRVENTGKVTVELNDAMPHTMVSYAAEMMLTGRVMVHVMIDYENGIRSGICLKAEVNMNPIVKMLVGDSAQKYLDAVVKVIEEYKGYEKIRGCSQPL